MEYFVSIISIALMIIGSIGIILLSRPLDKIIMFSILDSGFLLAVVLFRYLDVAFFVAISIPLSTIIFLLSIVKINEIRKRKVQSGVLHD